MANQGHVTLEDLPALKREYRVAVEEGEQEFEFKGMRVLTSYAKYLIEHLENVKKTK